MAVDRSVGSPKIYRWRALPGPDAPSPRQPLPGGRGGQCWAEGVGTHLSWVGAEGEIHPARQAAFFREQGLPVRPGAPAAWPEWRPCLETSLEQEPHTGAFHKQPRHTGGTERLADTWHQWMSALGGEDLKSHVVRSWSCCDPLRPCTRPERGGQRVAEGVGVCRERAHVGAGRG